MNINELYNDSKDAADDAQGGDLLTEKELPNGTPVKVKAVYTKAGTTKKGAPALTIKWEIVEEGHPFKGGSFFDSIYFSPGEKDTQKSYNKRMFAKLSRGIGLAEAFWATSPSTEAIAKAIKDTVIMLTPKWQAEGDGAQFMDNTSVWEPAGGGTAGGISPSGY